MERSATQEPEFGSAGWISMCDVYLLFSALAIALCFAVAVVAQQLGLEKREGDRLIAALQGQTKSLEDEHDALQQELTDLEDAGEHVPALRLQVETLSAEVVRLEPFVAQAHEAGLALDGAVRERDNAIAEAERLHQELERAVAQRAEAEGAHVAAVKEIADLREIIQGREAELAKARTDLAAARNTLAQAERRWSQHALEERDRQRREGQIRQELLGLKGPLDRVVFLFDRSDSMKKNDRWEDAKETMRLWLAHLPVKEAAVVLFSTGVDAHPNDGRLIVVDDENRARFAALLSSVSPGGATNTLDAIKQAYQYPNIDAIILFTDGQPNATRESSSDNSKTAIYRFIESQREANPRLRIHTIGVGDYFSGSMRDFLLKVAELTDGSFLGR